MEATKMKETKNETVNPLGVDKIASLLIKYSVPAIIGMVVNALYNVVDRIYIGNAAHIGKDGLAGLTIAFPIMIILLAFGVLFGTGGATLFSISLGEGKTKRAETVLGNSFTLLLIAGVFFCVVGQLFLPQLLVLFGASETVYPYAYEYMRVIFFGAVFQVVSMGLNNFLRADGQPKLAMITMFCGAGVNIILDPVFIYVFDMGIAGAAWATIISQFISMSWILMYFLKTSKSHKIKLKCMKLKGEIVAKIVALGMPGFLMQVCNSLLNVVLNANLLLYGGDIAVTAMGVVNSIQTLLIMPITGLVQGVQPIVSFNYGARKNDRVIEAERLAIIAATVVVVIGWILTRVMPAQLVGLFNKDADLLVFGSYALKTWFWALPVIGFQIVGSNYFQATGRSRIAMFLTMLRQVVLLIPAIFVFSRLGGLDGLLYAAPFADICATSITAACFIFSIRKLKAEKIEPNPVTEK